MDKRVLRVWFANENLDPLVVRNVVKIESYDHIVLAHTEDGTQYAFPIVNVAHYRLDPM